MLKLLMILSCTLAVAGCNSGVVYKIMPVINGKETASSRSLLMLKDEEASVTANFDNLSGNFISFFVVINNISSNEITISPGDFYNETYLTDSLDIESPAIAYALDPENEIEMIDKDMNNLEKDKQINDGINCCLIGGVAIFSIATAGSEKTEEEEAGEEAIWNSVVDKIGNDEADYQDEKYALEQEQQYWQHEVLRTVTIKPGDKAAGLFYIPFNRKATWIKLVIPVADKEFVYNFKVEIE